MNKKFNKSIMRFVSLLLLMLIVGICSYMSFAANTYTVFLASGSGYETKAVNGYTANNIMQGRKFCFTLTVHDGYDMSSPEVTVNDAVIEPVNGTYTIYNISSDCIVKVSGVVRNAYRVTLPEIDGCVFTASLGYDCAHVLHGDKFKFYLTLLSGYTSSVPVVSLNGTVLKAGTDGCFVLENLVSDVAEISVSGIKKNVYNIEFLNYDATSLKTDRVQYGDVPVYSGKIPQKSSDAQYTYSFSGWSPELCEAHADAKYTASFSSKIRTYKVTFVNYDSTELYTTTAEYGSGVQYPNSDPEKPADDAGTYVFSGWSVQTDCITGDTKAVAKYMHKHVFVDFVKDSTCVDKGYTIHTCKACGYSYTSEWTAKAPHIYSDWSVVTEATETTTGIKHRFCSVCNAEDTASIPVITSHQPDTSDDDEQEVSFSWFKFLFQKLIEFFKSLFIK